MVSMLLSLYMWMNWVGWDKIKMDNFLVVHKTGQVGRCWREKHFPQSFSTSIKIKKEGQVSNKLILCRYAQEVYWMGNVKHQFLYNETNYIYWQAQLFVDGEVAFEAIALSITVIICAIRNVNIYCLCWLQVVWRLWTGCWWCRSETNAC